MSTNDNNRDSGGNSFKDYKERKAKYQDRDNKDSKDNKKGNFKGGYRNDRKNDRQNDASEDYIVGINPVIEAIDGNRTINKIIITADISTAHLHYSFFHC